MVVSVSNVWSMHITVYEPRECREASVKRVRTMVTHCRCERIRHCLSQRMQSGSLPADSLRRQGLLSCLRQGYPGRASDGRVAGWLARKTESSSMMGMHL